MTGVRDLERAEMIYKMRKIGMTLDQIGEVYKISRQAVHLNLRRYGRFFEAKEYCAGKWYCIETVNLYMLALGGVIRNTTYLAILEYLGIKPTSAKAKVISRWDILKIYPVEFLQQTNAPMSVMEDLVNLLGTLGGHKFKRQIIRELGHVSTLYRELYNTP